jgi:hypothetical protein
MIVCYYCVLYTPLIIAGLLDISTGSATDICLLLATTALRDIVCTMHHIQCSDPLFPCTRSLDRLELYSPLYRIAFSIPLHLLTSILLTGYILYIYFLLNHIILLSFSRSLFLDRRHVQLLRQTCFYY